MEMEKRSLETLTIAGGWLCLDFVNTVSDRSIDSPFEYLSSYPHVLEWTNRVKLQSKAQNSHLDVLSRKRPIESAKSWIRTLEVREMLFQYFHMIAKGRSPELKDQNSFNKWLSKSLNKSVVEFDKNKSVLSWNIHPDDFDRHIYLVIKSAYDLLTSDKQNRIKECGPCGWLFLDKSKNNSRKWCKMETCGSHVKSRAYYQRQKMMKLNA